MGAVEFGKDGVRVEAALLARAFGISADDLKRDMRDGTITSRFERGEGKDAGTVRLIFFSASRRVRITADAGGHVLSCGAADFAGPPGSASRPAATGTGRGFADPDGQQAHIETLLDLALQGTFPASDPVAIGIDAPAPPVLPRETRP
ncbi:DUF6522 family protein [Paracoccus sp. TOH]|uniref:DUF6522 family protein n=1 Tax=Paracoccus simplex TaxID=2086346 RepID=A0ABV7S1L4_9RHOB|nr:DUF6522 family protein [Paracoccus sp. TOH]WJS87345.1 DUF6522 family protein [Paracoccus sp. TOH]